MKCVWVVENDAALCRTLARVLSAPPYGFDVRTFESIAKAEAALMSGEAPDGLLLDVMFPEGDSGPEFLSRHRAGRLRRTHVAFLTAHPACEISFCAESLDAALLIKPASSERFATFASAVRARALAGRTAALPDRVALAFIAFSKRWRLSPRQQEIVALFLRGLRAQHVAEDLQLSIETVRHHIRGILERSQLKDMGEVVIEILTEAAQLEGSVNPPAV